MKKILKLVFIALLFMPLLIVNGAEYNDKIIEGYKWMPNDFIIKQKGTRKKYQQLSMLVRNSDKQFVYCIEPGTSIDKNLNYSGSDTNQAYLANITEEEWNKVLLISYYGYGYINNNVNHTDLKWYTITQFMIWQVIPHGYDIYFTDKLNGKKITKYTSEIAEINSLIENHYKKPKFNQDEIRIFLGKELRLKDENLVLSDWMINKNDNLDVYIDNNELVINSKKSGKSTITLTKRDTRYFVPPIVYYDSNSQNVMSVGNYDPINYNIDIEVFGGKLVLDKYDYDCNCNLPSGDATLSGAKYGIYDKNNNLVETLITDNDAHAESNYLAYGEYTIKELEPSNGYNLDDNVYSFFIDENNLIANIKVYEKVINGKIDITKVISNVNTEITIPEPNVKFGLYDNNNNLLKEVITDKDGKIKCELSYGKYTLKQLTTTNGYKFVDDYSFEIKLNDEIITHTLINEEISAKIKVIKIDKETGNCIKIKGIKFRIKNIDKNEYVFQNNSDIFETNENGILITPYPLGHGNYLLEEVNDIIEGYVWNKESFEFSINDETKFIANEKDTVLEIKFENQPVKAKITLSKFVEDKEIINNKYNYYNKEMADITFGLYAKEDIYDGSGILVYKKNTLIEKENTNSKGKIIFDNLYLGKYYIKELSVLDGYIVDNNEYIVELKYKDQYTKEINYELKIVNYLKSGKLEFTKTDLISSEAIPNTKIQIYNDEDKLIYSGMTGQDGKIVIDKLPLGKYYIIETKSAIGYKLSDEKIYFEILENGEIVKANMKNEKIIVEVPNTEKNEYIIYILTSFVGITTFILIYEKIKNYKKR